MKLGSALKVKIKFVDGTKKVFKFKQVQKENSKKISYTTDQHIINLFERQFSLLKKIARRQFFRKTNHKATTLLPIFYIRINFVR